MTYANLDLWNPEVRARYHAALAELVAMTPEEEADPTNHRRVMELDAFVRAYESQTQAFVQFVADAPNIPPRVDET